MDVEKSLLVISIVTLATGHIDNLAEVKDHVRHLITYIVKFPVCVDSLLDMRG